MVQPKLPALQWASRPLRRSLRFASTTAPLRGKLTDQTAPGVYVATVIPAVPHWPQRKPWVMASRSSIPPGSTTHATTTLWARDYNEVKTLGGKSNSRRAAEQTQIAVFWEATLPPIYNGIALSIADIRGRDVAPERSDCLRRRGRPQTMRCLPSSTPSITTTSGGQSPRSAMATSDGNDVTERTPRGRRSSKPRCTPNIRARTALLPPSSVLCCWRRSARAKRRPALTTTGYLVERFGTELENRRRLRAGSRERACLRRGVHFRNSTEVGTALGKQVGAFAVAKFLQRSE